MKLVVRIIRAFSTHSRLDFSRQTTQISPVSDKQARENWRKLGNLGSNLGIDRLEPPNLQRVYRGYHD